MAVCAGLLIGDIGAKHGMSAQTREYVDAFWKMVDEILNAVLFLLIGLEVFAVAFDASYLLAGVMAIALALVARLAAVAVPVLTLKPFREFSKGVVPIMTWGGLKGGISVALALSLPESEWKPLILSATYIVVVFSIIVQGLTVAPPGQARWAHTGVDVVTDYLVYDVFTETPFGGNQLAVFPDARALPEDRLQAITREFNFSEVTFVYPPENPAHTAKLRIFTPTVEVPFAGHPTIGHGRRAGGVGLWPGDDPRTWRRADCLSCHARECTVTTKRRWRYWPPGDRLVARALAVRRFYLTQTHVPVMASLGLAFTLTELDCRDTLAALAPDRGAFLEGAAAHPAGLDFAQFAYVREGDIVQARMFAPLDNIPEDPATGSACATLGALLAEIEAQDVTLRIHQATQWVARRLLV